MHSIKAKKEDVLATIRTNREAHQAIYEEAVAGYKELAKEQLKKHLKDVDRGAMQTINFLLPAPVNHVKDYDRVIKMLEMEVADEVSLDNALFAQYIMDDWAWKQQFLTSNSSYSVTANTALQGR